jgi:membrane protease YdiL (CAAX protease family)
VEFVAADHAPFEPRVLTQAAFEVAPLTAPASLAPRRQAGVADAALAVGLAFLLARPAVGALPAAVPVLAAGYLAMAATALAAPAPAGAGAGEAPPLGWALPLGVGLAAVALAGVVAGPAPDPRVGAAGVGLGLLAAVAEEALFRRLLYVRLLARYGAVVAVLGSATLFALVHLPAYGTAALPVDLGAGLLLSWQRFASGRWTVPAVTHAVANLLAVT